MTNPIHAWAMAYYDVGWCIIPAIKKKSIVDWQQYQKERPSREQTDQWFIDAPPHAQIALVTGSISQVSVIDLDTHGEACGVKKKPRNTRACDCYPQDVGYLASQCGVTMRSITGSGGIHLFCVFEKDLRNSAKRLHPQVDIRSEGGLIILPPSLHESGKYYEWDKLFPFNANNIQNMMSFPEGWKEKLQEKFQQDWTKIVLEGAGEGKRNVTLASLIGKLLFTFDRDHLEAAWQMIWMWNQRNNPPIEEAELIKTFQSIVKTHFYGTAEYGRK